MFCNFIKLIGFVNFPLSLKVDFATMTKNYEDAQIETGASLEIDSYRTAEAATSITKDTGKKA